MAIVFVKRFPQKKQVVQEIPVLHQSQNPVNVLKSHFWT